MTAQEAYDIATAVMLALGGGGTIVFGLSSVLSKRWASHILAKEEALHRQNLQRLEHDGNKLLQELQSSLDIVKEKHLKGFNDRLTTYRLAVDLISEVLTDLETFYSTGVQQSYSRLEQFTRGRIHIYGYLSMLAPQTVMDANDCLTDYLILVTQGQATYEWDKVRDLALKLLNEIRKDIGFDTVEIFYNGRL